MSITVANTLPEEEWRRFVEEHPGANVFHTPEMFEVFDRAKGHRAELWAATQDGRVLALLLPVRITLKEGLLRYFTSRAIAYGGVLCAPGSEGQEALRILLHTYVHEAKRDLLFTELRNRTDIRAIRSVLEQPKFRFEEECNFLVELALPVEDMWRSISRSTQKKIKRTRERGNLTIEELREREKLPVWYGLIQETFSRVHVPLADYSLFESAFDTLYPQGKIRFLLVRVQDRYIAASVALLYKAAIYDWYRGFDLEYGGFHPNDAMVWHMLKWGAENGYRVFDFGGAGKPDEDYGPRTFKSRFGGTLVNYGRCICIHAPVRLKLSQVGYQVLRRVL